MMISNPSRSNAPRWRKWGAFLFVAFLSSACASVPLPGLDLANWSSSDSSTPATESTEWTDARWFEPAGPGAVFFSREAAAKDALAYCYLESLEVVAADREARAGAIYPVDGGYSYDEPSSERLANGSRLRYRLRSTDVAHFRHYPVGSRVRLDRRNGLLAREVRNFVVRRDRLGRPIFLLTPDRLMRVYAAGFDDFEILARVERGTRRGSGRLEIRGAKSLGPALALVEGLPPALPNAEVPER